MFLSSGPCEIIRMLIPFLPKAANSLPETPGLNAIFLPTTAIIAKNKPILMNEPPKILVNQSNFKELVFGKESIARQLLITKEMYKGSDYYEYRFIRNRLYS